MNPSESPPNHGKSQYKISNLFLNRNSIASSEIRELLSIIQQYFSEIWWNSSLFLEIWWIPPVVSGFTVSILWVSTLFPNNVISADFIQKWDDIDSQYDQSTGSITRGCTVTNKLTFPHLAARIFLISEFWRNFTLFPEIWLEILDAPLEAFTYYANQFVQNQVLPSNCYCTNVNFAWKTK